MEPTGRRNARFSGRNSRPPHDPRSRAGARRGCRSPRLWPTRIETRQNIGQWDNRIFQDEVSELTDSVNSPLDHLDAGYIKRDPLAWFCSHRHQQDGSDQIYNYSYLFKYRLEVPAGAKMLTLPDNPRIRIVAVSAAQNENDATVAMGPLYDDFTGRTAIQLKNEK